MPFVNIRITKENSAGASVEQKKELIEGVSDLLVKVLNKTKLPLSLSLMR